MASAFSTRFLSILFGHVGSGGSDLNAYDRIKYDTLHGDASDINELLDEFALGAFDLQVNGDIREALNASGVQALLRSARPERVPTSIVNMPSAEQRAAVVITVKAKRRLSVRE